jgi:hypothetical protein
LPILSVVHCQLLGYNIGHFIEILTAHG